MLFKRKDWRYFNEVIPESWDYDRTYYEYRWCINTNKLQKFQTHCLGLNPPEYVGNWQTIQGKPYIRFDKEKSTWIITKIVVGEG